MSNMAPTRSVYAIDKNSPTKWVGPSRAVKGGEHNYICPCCSNDVMPVQGPKNTHHFRHYTQETPCTFYDDSKSSQSESDAHNNAKMLMKRLLETGINVSFVRPCNICDAPLELPPIELDSATIYTEYRFDHDGHTVAADVACVKNDEILQIIEIYHTHKTRAINRPEPWVEVNATKLLELVSICGGFLESIQINCIRQYNCEKCIKKLKEDEEREKTRVEEENIKLVCRQQEEEKKRVARQQEEERSRQEEEKKRVARQQEEERSRQEEEKLEASRLAARLAYAAKKAIEDAEFEVKCKAKREREEAENAIREKARLIARAEEAKIQAEKDAERAAERAEEAKRQAIERKKQEAIAAELAAKAKIERDIIAAQLKVTLDEYLATLNEVELQAMEIAKSHLKTSFCLEKSSGFVAFLANKKKKAP